MCAPLRRREPRTYAMVAHSARDGGARPPQLARGPSRGADGAPDDVRLWPLPRASQTDEEAGADEPRNQSKQKGYMYAANGPIGGSTFYSWNGEKGKSKSRAMTFCGHYFVDDPRAGQSSPACCIQ